MKARLWFLFSVCISQLHFGTKQTWWNERKLRRRAEITWVFYNNPHYYLLWSANFSVSMEGGIFYSKAEENGGLHCKRTSASFRFKICIRKASNSLSLRVARGKQKSVCTCTHIVLPERALLRTSNITFYLLHRWESGQYPRSFWMCSDTLPNNLFETGKEFSFVGTVGFFFVFFFLQCPPAALGSRLEGRFKLLQVHGCQRIQYKYSLAQWGDTLLAPAPSASCEGQLFSSERRIQKWQRKEKRSLFHEFLPDNGQLSLANTISPLIKPLIKPVSALTFIPPSICVQFLR